MEPREPIASGAQHEEVVRSLASYLIEETNIDEAGARHEAREALQEATRSAAGMFDLATRRWWVLTLRGVLALAIGVIALIKPLTAASALVLFFGAWILIDGIMALIASLAGRGVWQLVLGGLLGFGLGLLIIMLPAESLTLFYIIAAAWALTRGVSDIVLGSRLRAGGRAALVTLGILSCLLGLALLFAPGLGLTALGFWVALYAIAHGVLYVVMSFQLRGAGKKRRPATLRQAHA